MTILMMDRVINYVQYKINYSAGVSGNPIFQKSAGVFTGGCINLCRQVCLAMAGSPAYHYTTQPWIKSIKVSVFTSAHSLHGAASSFCRSLLLRTVATYLTSAVVLLCSLKHNLKIIQPYVHLTTTMETVIWLTCS